MAETLDARLMLRVASPAAWKAKQQKVFKAAQRLGVPIESKRIAMPIMARIEHNRWLLDCVCGSGVAVQPEWPEAHCLGLGCGRTYTHIVIPADRRRIEATLSKRPAFTERNWDPRKGESLESLMAEDRVRGLT